MGRWLRSEAKETEGFFVHAEPLRLLARARIHLPIRFANGEETHTFAPPLPQENPYTVRP